MPSSLWIPRVFPRRALPRDPPMVGRDEVDCSVLVHLGELVEHGEVGPRRGGFAAHGLTRARPELSAGLPRANRALVARRRVRAAGDGGPQPLELWAVLLETMRVPGRVEVAEGFELALDAHPRSAELLGLRVGGATVTDGADGNPPAAPCLGAIERGKRAMAGAKQGALIERQHVSLMALRRRSSGKQDERLFSMTADRHRRAP
ncbi:unnamed protein product [Prorocentrum cordatum]|uniref:Uncharacterized protein n=1 Tax=Prorocentrum cordatum TaxID=2364126 RepID=A0ABN9PQL7_9DINO|nr:unnamed protein product [Polarella glacialis]